MARYKDWKTKRFYETGAVNDPSSWVYVDHPTHKDWYNLSTILDLMDSAEKAGINPLYYVALGISETGLQDEYSQNPTRVFYKHHPELVSELIKIPDSQLEKKRKATLDYGARYLAKMLNKYSDPLRALQAYSGTGKTIYSGHPDVVQYYLGTHKVFGRPYNTINFWEKAPQGLRVLEIMSALQNTPGLEGLFSPTVTRYLGRY